MLPPQALPAVEYPADVKDWSLEAMVPDLLLWSLIAAYTLLTVRDIVKSVHMERKVGQHEDISVAFCTKCVCPPLPDCMAPSIMPLHLAP